MISRSHWVKSWKLWGWSRKYFVTPAGSLQLRQLAAALWQSSYHHCFGVTIIAMMISDTAVTMMMMVLVVMVMMMTVDRWQRVPMVGGFRGNGAHSSRPAPLCPFLRHYSPVRSPFFAPAGRSVALDFCQETIFPFQIWCTLTCGFLSCHTFFSVDRP